MAKKGTSMTLYERIMVYRKLKEGGEETDRQSHHAHEEHTATRELQVQMEEQIIDRQTSSAMADSAAVNMATVVMATRAQSSTAERREVRKANKEERRGSHSSDKDRHEHGHKETHAARSEETRDVRRSEISQKDATAPAPSASKPKSRSEFPAKMEERECKQAIDALDKLAEKNLQRLLGEGEGKGEEMSEMDRKLLEKVFSAQFQAELDLFLRTT